MKSHFFIIYAVGMLCAGGAAEVLPLTSLHPPVFLPDGTEFKTWEAPFQFAKTYYVNGSDARASDKNPGTEEQPFATINHAAQVLRPGERVIVAAGVYRERINPRRGGVSPTQMISYEAAPGAPVILKGSRIFRESWLPSGASIWKARLKSDYFAGYNPFDIDNVTSRQFDIMDFAAPLRGKPPCSLPRGLVFQNGRRLTQAVKLEELSQREGTYWVDRPNQVLYAHFFGHAQPDQALIEITTQETIFAPEKMGLGFIRVKGFVLEQVAGPFPWEQVGAISTTRGHHWIIEDNTVREVNGVGIDIGVQLHRWPQPKGVGFHIVRRNTVTDCGICGIAGLGPGRGQEFGLLVEDNVLLRNAFFDIERLYETAGIKLHDNVHCLIRRNLVVDTRHGAGIWMDWNNQHSRCSQNVIIGSQTIHGGIFIEASYLPNLIDQNFVWDTQGNGIYEHDCSRQIFAHNLIGRSSASAFHLHGKITDRRVGGVTPEYGQHQVRNNIWVENGKTNVFRGLPSEIDCNLAEGIKAAFDRNNLVLEWSVNDDFKISCPPVPGVTHDFWGEPRKGPQTPPGPFGESPVQPKKVFLGSPGATQTSAP